MGDSVNKQEISCKHEENCCHILASELKHKPNGCSVSSSVRAAEKCRTILRPNARLNGWDSFCICIAFPKVMNVFSSTLMAVLSRLLLSNFCSPHLLNPSAKTVRTSFLIYIYKMSRVLSERAPCLLLSMQTSV